MAPIEPNEEFQWEEPNESEDGWNYEDGDEFVEDAVDGSDETEEDYEWEGSDEDSCEETSSDEEGYDDSLERELVKGENLTADRLDEIEDTKDADSRLASLLSLSKDKYTITPAVVNICDLVIPSPVKDSRKETYLGITQSVGELGVLTPIHVMVLEGYADHLAEGGTPEEYDGPKYALIDGLRRIFAAQKNNIQRVNAMVWEFQDKDAGSDALNLISLLLNKHQRRSWAEIWYLYQVVEESATVSPGMVEYLLGLEPGDATKLKEIMTRADDFPEPKDDLLSKKKTLEQAYKALMKAMKEQDSLLREDVQGVKEVEQSEGVIDDGAGNRATLSDEEVKDILDMGEKFEGDLSDAEFNTMVGNDIEAERFDVDGDRHLDPALRAAVLQRDEYSCVISGIGVKSGLPTEVALAILNVHHLVPVADGGTNEMSNLVTVSMDVHTLIHVIQRRGGRLGMKREDYDELDDDKKDYIKKVMKFARIAVEADRRCGKTREQVKEDTADAVRFKMPGAVQQQNIEALAAAKASE